MRARRHKKATPLILIVLTLLVLAPLVSCSGGGSSDPTTPDTTIIGDTTQGDNGSITFKIAWPRSGQLIPPETNRINVFVIGEGMDPITLVINDVGQPETSVQLAVLAGSDRMVSVEARHVPNMPPDIPPMYVNPTREDLLSGYVLASGRSDAFDLAVGEHKSLVITLGPPAHLHLDDDYITAGGRQIDPGGFPIVVLYCAVADQDGNPIWDLTRANFRVYEQTQDVVGDPVEAVILDVRYVTQSGEEQYGSVGLTLDRSGSMSGGAIYSLKEAVNFFVDLMHAQDQAQIVSFGGYVSLDQTWTTDKDVLHSAINSLDASGMTPLYDAVIMSIEETATQPGRRAVLIFTDGKENYSSHTLYDVAVAAAKALVPCYTIGLGNVNVYQLEALADATGGECYITPSTEELREIYGDVATTFQSQVRITYLSPDPTDYDPDRRRNVFVYLTNYPPLTNNGDVLGYQTQYWY